MRPGMGMALAATALVAGCGDDKGTTIKEGTAPQTVTQTKTVTTQAPQTSTGAPGGQATVARSDAERSARREASSQLESQPGGFTVNEADWQVNCSGGESGGAWSCKLNSGPCSGTADVTPRADGLSITVAKVGCTAD